MFKLDIKDSDIMKLQNNVEDIINKKMFEIEKASIETMKIMEAEAVAAAPTGRTGRLKSSIKWMQTGKLSYQLRADTNYAAYVEFGTGPNFKMYPGKESFWQKKAKEFYRNGRGMRLPMPYFYPTVTKNMIKLKEKFINILGKNA
jgi:hypothetical protein